MAVSNSSAAYDLSAYAAANQRQKPQLQVVANKKSRTAVRSVLNLRVISAFVIVVTLVSLMVYNQVQLNEVSGRVNALSAQLRELESEKTRMMSELEATLSLRTIEEQAKHELGMNRLDKYQTTYIMLEQEDRIALTEYSPEQSLGQKIRDGVQSAITKLQEYIGRE